MQINSFSYLGYILLAVASCHLARRLAGASGFKLCLSLLSLLFVALNGWLSLAALLGSILVNYATLRQLRQMPPATRGRLLWPVIALNVACIFIPKVSTLAFLGASYYSIQQIMMLVDFYQQPEEVPSLWSYLAFVSFFPCITAGPICSWSDTGDELSRPRGATDRELFLGLLILAFGLFQKCVLAATCNQFTDGIKAYHAPINALDSAVGMTMAYLGLYFDFSGYSDIAMGTGMLLGLTVPLNFDRPLAASSLPDFWSRWHMTLTSFVRFYIFYPLVRWRPGSRTTAKLAVLVSMLVVGLWHGLTASFALFGLVHGLAQLVPTQKLPRPLGWLLTQLFVVLSMPLFFQPTLDGAVQVWAGLLHAKSIRGPFAAIDIFDKAVAALCLVFALWQAWRWPNTRDLFSQRKPSLALLIVLQIMLLLSLLYLNSGYQNNFFYADF